MKQVVKMVVSIFLTVCLLAGTLPSTVYNVAEAAEKKPVAISKTKATLYVGTTTTLKMQGTNKKVKWSSSKKKIATVTAKGKVKAKKVGTTTIKAKVGKKTYKCKVTVKKAPKLSTKKAIIYAGKSKQISIKGYKIGKAAWSSSNKKVAKVNSNGKITAINKGTAYIYAKIGGKTLKCKVTVKTIPVQWVSLSPVTVKLYVGQTYTYRKPAITPSNATYSSIKWSTDDPCVKIVNGKITALADGAATITVTVGGKTATAYVFVDDERVNLNKERSRMYVGETQQMKATIDPGVVPGKKIKWRSGDPSIATVTQTGLVKGISEGSVKIYAKVDGYEIYQSIHIEAPDVDIDPYSKTMYVGDTYAVEHEVDQGTAKNPVTWKSDNKSVATVDQKGVVTAVGVGKAKITVSCSGGSDSFTVTVKEWTATSVNVTPASASMNMGETTQLSVSVSPANYPASSITWTSDDSSIASVVDGVVTAHSPGTTYIRAHAGSKTDYCKVTIKGVAVTSLTFDKSGGTIYPGDSFRINATISPADATLQDITWKSSNENVATVEDGVVTGHSEGKATITGTVGGKSAICSVTVVERPVILNVGETWTVEDNWRLTINSVVTHKKCNTIQNDKGEQVVTVNYTYYNDGYITSSGGGIMFASSQMDIYDENGAVGSSYVCKDQILAKTIDIGKSCTATEVFILPAESEKIELTIETLTKEGKRVKATFKLPVSKPIDVIKDYISNNGSVSSEGYRYIMPSKSYDVETRVTYVPETQQLIFSETGGTDEMDAETYIYYDIGSQTVTNVAFNCESILDGYIYEAIASMDTATYKHKDTLDFVQSGGEIPEYVTTDRLNETANICLNTLMMGIEVTLLENTGYELKDIGFSSFEPV